MVDFPHDNQSLGDSKLDAQRAEIEFLRKSRADIRAGRTQPAVQALERLARKYGLRQRRK
jgi:hypothetical protein